MAKKLTDKERLELLEKEFNKLKSESKKEKSILRAELRKLKAKVRYNANKRTENEIADENNAKPKKQSISDGQQNKKAETSIGNNTNTNTTSERPSIEEHEYRIYLSWTENKDFDIDIIEKMREIINLYELPKLDHRVQMYGMQLEKTDVYFYKGTKREFDLIVKGINIASYQIDDNTKMLFGVYGRLYK